MPAKNQDINLIIDFIKNKYPSYNICLITNGTTLHKEEIRRKILNCDLVIPSIDAIDEKTFQQINRPIKELKLNQILEGIIDFSSEFNGELWIEIFLIKGINHNSFDYEFLNQILKKINPHKIQLNTVDRPTAYKNIEPVTYEEMSIFASKISFFNVDFSLKHEKINTTPPSQTNPETLIFNMIIRRPCTLEDIKQAINIPKAKLESILKNMEIKNLITSETGKRGLFYKITGHLEDNINKQQSIAILGISSEKTRYSFMAYEKFLNLGYNNIFGINPKKPVLQKIKVVEKINDLEQSIDTLTIYVSPSISSNLIDEIVALSPKRIILNPGSENNELETIALKHNIEVIKGCTLVMLSTNQF